MHDERRFFHIVVNVVGGDSSNSTAGVVFQALSCSSGCYSIQTVKKTIPLYACTV